MIYVFFLFFNLKIIYSNYSDGASCLYKPQDIGATMTAYKVIPSGDENALEAAVANVGPISVGIDASAESFQLYQKGVYYEPG